MVSGSTQADFDRIGPTRALDAPLERVKMVNSSRARALARLGMSTIRDLVTHFPHRYIDLSRVETLGSVRIGEACTVVGSIHEIGVKRPRPRLDIVEIVLVDGTGTLIVSCFRQPWLAAKLSKGMRIAVSGKVEFNFGFSRMTNPFIEVLPGDEGGEGIIVPVHPVGEGMTTAWMRRLMANALDEVRGIEDPVPLEMRVAHRLMSRGCALRSIHFPQSMAEAGQARRRLVYEELLLLELHLMMEGARARLGSPATAHVVDGPRQESLSEVLGFALTGEQERARDELLDVMAASSAGDHMLLGDVGTGKTAVAAFGLAAVADTGTQALMMAPTEVLALQYARKLGPVLDAVGVPWGLLTSSTASSKRRAVLKAAASGDITVLFGTHALLDEDVVMRACTLVVIDEQQRFGVAQREALLSKGIAPDVLSMTATPIPRSLALALFGNMTLSYLHARPLNAAGNMTRALPRDEQGKAYDAALAALGAGHQVFVICPLVGQRAAAKDEAQRSEDGFERDGGTSYAAVAIEGDGDAHGEDVKAAAAHVDFLQRKTFIDYRVALLHGKMPSAEKRAVMDGFRAGDIDVLVSTTVVEVGVDVPNATVMIVEDADRFGLAQLHQLRGRVGRGSEPGEVFLLSGSRAPQALKRLGAMERTEDGFELSEYDLSLRREGDILGNRQHGASSLKLVNIVRDAAAIEAARHDARALLDADPLLEGRGHRALAREVRTVFGAQGKGRV